MTGGSGPHGRRGPGLMLKSRFIARDSETTVMVTAVTVTVTVTRRHGHGDS